MVTAYSNQNYSQAESLATEAYLENSFSRFGQITDGSYRGDTKRRIETANPGHGPFKKIQQQLDIIGKNLNDTEKSLVGNAS